MNRDEKRSRMKEIAPKTCSLNKSKSLFWIGPVDSQSKGTWIASSSSGVVACLTNHYPQKSKIKKTPTMSRGKIIPKLLSHGPIKECENWMDHHFNPTPFAPFKLNIFSSYALSYLCLERNSPDGKTSF